jgi:hypothetical protein
MSVTEDLLKRMMERFGGIIDLKERPEVLDEIVIEVSRGKGAHPPAAQSTTAPFGVSWMDSWVAHHVFAENLASLKQRDREVATALQGLVDLRFRARLDEITRIIRNEDEPPDGGPPEPGVPNPPAGPSPGGIIRNEPPDGGPPEPGVPNPPAGPGPSGPDMGSFRENPWILYWFLSIKAPMLLDVIDLHISRRIDSLRRR